MSTTAETSGRQAPEQWWPSPFGGDDQLGMLNHVTDLRELTSAVTARGRAGVGVLERAVGRRRDY